MIRRGQFYRLRHNLLLSMGMFGSDLLNENDDFDLKVGTSDIVRFSR